jgi:hypothetical protein
VPIGKGYADAMLNEDLLALVLFCANMVSSTFHWAWISLHVRAEHPPSGGECTSTRSGKSCSPPDMADERSLMSWSNAS